MWRVEQRWFCQIADCIFPSGADERLRFGAADLPLERFIAAIWRRAPLSLRLGVRLALWLVVWSPLLVIGVWRRFGGLNAAQRLAHLRRLGESRFYLVRELPLLLKTVICLGVCGHPEYQQQVGLTQFVGGVPPWMAESDR